MMAKIRPFAALRPRPDVAAKVASPPYDVVDTAKARKLAEGNPVSFLHVVRPEIDLPEGTDLYSDEVYATAAANLRKLVEEGVLVKEDTPCLYLYAQQMGDHRQTGVVACCAVSDYDQDVIRKHELTRADKEADRTRHVDETNANTGPVFLTYRADPKVDALVDRALETQELLYDFVAEDGVGHTVHKVSDPELVAGLVEAFGGMDRLYVADGHHRSASAARVGRERRAKAGAAAPADAEYDWFLAVLFPHDQLRILPYNRVVLDMGGLTPDGLLAKVEERFQVTGLDVRGYSPDRRHHVGMYLDGRWYRLEPRHGTFPEGHPTRSLDVAILQENLLAPVFGIEDPRRDPRIRFVGGIHGPRELERQVDEGDGLVAFSMFPVSVEELMAIADAGEIMPPKSTWFEPKLRSGLLIHELS